MRALIAALGLGTVVGCGGGEPAPLAPVQTESPLVAIRRVGEKWTATVETKTFQDPPSPTTMTQSVTRSTVVFRADKSWGPETIEVSERFDLRAGGTVSCLARGETHVDLVFGRRSGDPAVEMRRPALTLRQSCDPAGFAPAELELPATTARFRLTGDQLVPFDPPLEKRVYLPE